MSQGKHRSHSDRASGRGHLVLGLVLALVFVAIPTSGAFAANPAKYTGILTATPNSLHAGEFFDVNGCGYDVSLGNVILSFTHGSWGSPLTPSQDDPTKGCFTITGIPALSGDTLPPGTYQVRALQYVHNKWTETGDTTVTVIP